jgi:hypothetical protein
MRRSSPLTTNDNDDSEADARLPALAYFAGSLSRGALPKEDLNALDEPLLPGLALGTGT